MGGEGEGGARVSEKYAERSIEVGKHKRERERVCVCVEGGGGDEKLARCERGRGREDKNTKSKIVCLFVGCLTSQQHASVSQGRICTDNFTCYHTEIEAADQTFHLTQSQYTDTGPTSPSADPITPGAWQGKPLECQCLSHWYDSAPKKSRR